MKRIVIYRHPECKKCARMARLHHLFDWFNRVAVVTTTPRTGPLQMGEIIVEDLATGRFLAGGSHQGTLPIEFVYYGVGFDRHPSSRSGRGRICRLRPALHGKLSELLSVERPEAALR